MFGPDWVRSLRAVAEFAVTNMPSTMMEPPTEPVSPTPSTCLRKLSLSAITVFLTSANMALRSLSLSYASATTVLTLSPVPAGS